MSDQVYSRRDVLAGLAGVALGAGCAQSPVSPAKSAESVVKDWSRMPATERMPSVFIGHGTPMSAIKPNHWTETWSQVGANLPRPAAILVVSAHWLTRDGALVTASEAPPMNYDMQNFPPEMYRIVYPAPGDVGLAKEVAKTLSDSLPVYGDTSWGFDHATWVVLKYMFPKADVPVIQLSIDYNKPPAFHYETAKYLQTLRTKGVLILGSGNLVHNLRMREPDNKPYDWALEFDQTITRRVKEGDHKGVVDFLHLGSMAALSHPTYDHFLPLLYCLGVKTDKDQVTSFNDSFQWSAVTMRSFLIDA
jgi:4,5-DOPA dioxygenase extradiol